MSRIGKLPVTIPAGVDVKIDKNIITFSKGNLSEILDTKGNVEYKLKDNKLSFNTKGDDRQSKAFWGTYRALANNIIIGLTNGFEKKLEITGVGYKAAVKGKVLELSLGFSHPVNYDIPSGVEISVEKNVTITIKGVNKQQIGQIASEIRGFRPPEPYKGKGVKYSNETIRRKAGKTGKK